MSICCFDAQQTIDYKIARGSYRVTSTECMAKADERIQRALSCTSDELREEYLELAVGWRLASGVGDDIRRI